MRFYKFAGILGLLLWMGSAIAWTLHYDGGYLAGAGFICLIIALISYDEGR